jgi:diadenosine tetraphosphatase ApaH/serine/threonine PP2A family protein phosphatase
VRYLILSDIHGNWEALEAVLRDAEGDYDEVLCCGDLVGYGADPNRVVDWTRERAKLVVRGNHDKGCAGLDDLEWFNPVARAAATWTGQSLTPDNLNYLRNLPKGPAAMDSFQILHGSPLDEDDYLVSSFAIAQVAPYLERQVSFFGHTHLQGGFLCHRNGVKRLARPEGEESRMVVELERDALYLINPGSVGQPRDGDPRAGYVIYDPDSRLVEFRRVPYDVRAAQAKIRDAGLPELLAERLEFGN